ncbi:MAG TPA: hypothetical protein VGM52_18505 [Herbaspirillum sp.]
MKKFSNALPKPLKRPAGDCAERLFAINDETASSDWVSQIGAPAAGVFGKEYVGGKLARFAARSVTMADCCGVAESCAATLFDGPADRTAFRNGALKELAVLNEDKAVTVGMSGFYGLKIRHHL